MGAYGHQTVPLFWPETNLHPHDNTNTFETFKSKIKRGKHAQ